jgi:hypothetical protein
MLLDKVLIEVGATGKERVFKVTERSFREVKLNKFFTVPNNLRTHYKDNVSGNEIY